MNLRMNNLEIGQFMNAKKLLAVALMISSLVITNCRGKQEKPSDDQTAVTTPTAQDNNNSAVDSTPLSFDAAGSDSGNIDGLKTVQFEYDKASLSANSKKVIEGNVEWMKKNSKTKVQIEGHCDNRGSIEYNVALGERRANTVKDYMISLGINANRLSTISYGEEKPVVAGDNEQAWAKNRRANFVPASM